MSREDNHFIDPEDNTTLVITNAQPHDAGGYTCRVMIRARDEISITHRLIVNTHSFRIAPVKFLHQIINHSRDGSSNSKQRKAFPIPILAYFRIHGSAI